MGSISSDGTFFADSDTPKMLELEGMSKDGYGLLSPSFMQKDGKTILMGIVPDKLSSQNNYNFGWAHTYSLPREVTLSNGTLVEKPFSGLASMRTSSAVNKTNFTLNGTDPVAVSDGRSFEIEASFKVSSSAFGLHFLKNGSKMGKLTINPNGNKVTVDLTSLDRIVNDGATFNGVYEAQLPSNLAVGSTCKIDFYLDHSILDVFINDAYAFSIRVFATDAEAKDVELFSTGSTTVESLKAWNIRSISTDIGSISADKSPFQAKDSAIYNLGGQRISTPTHGIYIQNGKKIVKK